MLGKLPWRPDEVPRIAAEFKHPINRLAYLFGIATGFRWHEIQYLTGNVVLRPEPEKAYYRPTCIVRVTKGNRPRYFTVTDEVVGILDAALAAARWDWNENRHFGVFQQVLRSDPWQARLAKPIKWIKCGPNHSSAGSIYQEKEAHRPPYSFMREHFDADLKQACAAVGLHVGYSTHSMRKTFAANQIRAGAGLYQLMCLMGHASPKDTVKYLQDLDTTEATRLVEGALRGDKSMASAFDEFRLKGASAIAPVVDPVEALPAPAWREPVEFGY